MIKTFPLLLFITALNFSCNSVNSSLAQDINQDYSFLIDSTKSVACNICLVEDMRKEAHGEFLMIKATGAEYEKEKSIFDSLVTLKTKILEVYKKELGPDSPLNDIEKYAVEQCLGEFSFPVLSEAETTELFLKFDSYYWSLQIPIPYPSKFSIDDFEEAENGKYIYLFKGNKFLMSETELENQFKKVYVSYDNLISYKNSMVDYYYNEYTGKLFSQRDRTEQLMFLEHKNRTLNGLYKMQLEEVVKKKKEIQESDLKLQALKQKYLNIIELKNN
jgi:hypothetical protein